MQRRVSSFAIVHRKAPTALAALDVNLKTMIALVDTKVSIGTFVQLIRHQTFGLLGHLVQSGWIALVSIVYSLPS